MKFQEISRSCSCRHPAISTGIKQVPTGNTGIKQVPTGKPSKNSMRGTSLSQPIKIYDFRCDSNDVYIVPFYVFIFARFCAVT